MPYISTSIYVVWLHVMYSKLKLFFGFSDTVLNWLQFYLSDLQHCITMGGRCSATVKSGTGVPQDSALGPFLFSIFTTPVGNIMDSFGVAYYQHADGTQLYTTINLRSSDRLASLSACANAVTSWHLDNDLLLNTSKMGAIIRISQQIDKFDQSSGVAFAGSNLPFVNKVRISMWYSTVSKHSTIMFPMWTVHAVFTHG